MEYKTQITIFSILLLVLITVVLMDYSANLAAIDAYSKALIEFQTSGGSDICGLAELMCARVIG